MPFYRFSIAHRHFQPASHINLRKNILTVIFPLNSRSVSTVIKYDFTHAQKKPDTMYTVQYVTLLCHLQRSTEVQLISYGAETHQHSDNSIG